jgi:hypothetical protein
VTEEEEEEASSLRNRGREGVRQAQIESDKQTDEQRGRKNTAGRERETRTATNRRETDVERLALHPPPRLLLNKSPFSNGAPADHFQQAALSHSLLLLLSFVHREYTTPPLQPPARRSCRQHPMLTNYIQQIERERERERGREGERERERARNHHLDTPPLCYFLPRLFLSQEGEMVLSKWSFACLRVSLRFCVCLSPTAICGVQASWQAATLWGECGGDMRL